MNRSFQIGLACAFGAAIGTLVALQLNPLLWWLGPLVGGLIAYLAYDWQDVLEKVPTAFRSVRNIPEGISEFFGLIGGILVATLYAKGSLQGTMWLTSGLLAEEQVELIVLISMLIVAGAVVARTYGDRTSKLREQFGWNPFKLGLMLTVLMMPPVSIVIASASILFWTWRLIRLLPLALWILFKLIHSELRLLCLCNATIGASIGYFAGNVLIGAIAGGVIGLVNYELISKRWLKLTI